MAERLVDTSGAPPLLLWALVCATLLLASAGVWIWTADELPPRGLPQDLRSCVRAWESASVPAQQRKVVAIGTSLLAESTGAPAAFQARLHNARWLPCIALGGNWSDALAMLPLVERLHPDVLLIHDGLIVKQTRSQWLARILLTTNHKFRRTIGWSIPASIPPGYCDNAPPADVDELTTALRTGPDINAEANAWLQRLEAAGTRVVIASIPRSPTLYANIAGPLAERESMLRNLASKANSSVWTFSAPDVPNAYCRDLAHMAEDGRAVFAPQLAQHLNQALAGVSR